ncbi:MAG: hypothetical protein ACFFDT_24855 [Candidatus Hodarchaeota archaeon]
MAEASSDYLFRIMVGEVVLSENTGNCLRRLRVLLGITQMEVSAHLNIASSVISDYEANRRKSPGILWIRNFIRALIELEETKGFPTLSILTPLIEKMGTIEPIITAIQFPNPFSLMKFCKAVDATIRFPIKDNYEPETYILGFLVVDGRKLLERCSSNIKGNLMEVVSNIAIIFENTQTGRGVFSLLPVNDPLYSSIWVFPKKGIDLNIIKSSVGKLHRAKTMILTSKLSSLEQMLANLERSISS